MSETPENTVDETVEPANDQASGGEDSQTDRSWLDGDPDPDRLVSYASNLRKERAELREKLDRETKAWEDEAELKERLTRLGYEFDDNTDEPDYDEDDEDLGEDDPNQELRQQVSDLAQREQQRELAEFRQQFDTHVDGLTEGMELTDRERALIWAESAANGGNNVPTKAGTEKAVKDLRKWREELENQAIAKYRDSKNAPHVPTGGKPSKGPQPDLTTTEGRSEFYRQKMAGP